MVKLVSLAASYRPGSLNRMLIEQACQVATAQGATVEMLDYAQCEAPIYREDQTHETLPPGAEYLRAALARNDGWMLAAPEYNWSMPGALKNLIDWLSVASTDAFKGKVILLLSASPSERGGRMGLQQLRVPLEVLGGMVYPRVISIGQAQKALGAEGFTREKDQKFVEDTVTGFVEMTRRLCA
jgi:chromate reductase, NAD(P)H dehydrogenase (quinone)